MLDAPQGTEAWLQARVGKATASRIADIVASKGKIWGESRYTYEGELVAERLSGVPYEAYTNSFMEWGTRCEPQARAEYAFLADVDVIEVGFIDHPTVAMSGASPDGFIGTEGLIEIKAPMTKNHIATLLGEPLPIKYLTQIQWQLSTTGRLWCDLCSFDPRLPDYARLFIKRVYRDDNRIAYLEHEVRVFLDEVAEKTERIRALNHV